MTQFETIQKLNQDQLATFIMEMMYSWEDYSDWYSECFDQDALVDALNAEFTGKEEEKGNDYYCGVSKALHRALND